MGTRGGARQVQERDLYFAIRVPFEHARSPGNLLNKRVPQQRRVETRAIVFLSRKKIITGER